MLDSTAQQLHYIGIGFIIGEKHRRRKIVQRRLTAEVSKGSCAEAVTGKGVRPQRTPDMSKTIGFRFKSPPSEEEIRQFVKDLGVTDDLAGFVLKLPAQIDLTFMNRYTAVQLDRKMCQLKNESKAVPSHLLYVSDK